jgi:prepilin peptidase CpaA
MDVPRFDVFSCSILVGLLAAAAAIDIRERRIPNMLVGLLAIAGLTRAAWFGGWVGLGAAVGGFAAGIGLLYFQFSRGWMGAGDVKLLGAIGAWTGWLGAIQVLIAGSIVGGMLAITALVHLGRSERAEVKRNVLQFTISGGLVVPDPSRISHARGVPFGVALAVAGAVVAFIGALR